MWHSMSCEKNDKFQIIKSSFNGKNLLQKSNYNFELLQSSLLL